jgi:hypothetical protein
LKGTAPLLTTGPAQRHSPGLVFLAGAIICFLGCMIGLGGAEFRPPCSWESRPAAASVFDQSLETRVASAVGSNPAGLRVSQAGPRERTCSS